MGQIVWPGDAIANRKARFYSGGGRLVSASDRENECTRTHLHFEAEDP